MVVEYDWGTALHQAAPLLDGWLLNRVRRIRGPQLWATEISCNTTTQRAEIETTVTHWNQECTDPERQWMKLTHKSNEVVRAVWLASNHSQRLRQHEALLMGRRDTEDMTHRHNLNEYSSEFRGTTCRSVIWKKKKHCNSSGYDIVNFSVYTKHASGDICLYKHTDINVHINRSQVINRPVCSQHILVILLHKTH